MLLMHSGTRLYFCQVSNKAESQRSHGNICFSCISLIFYEQQTRLDAIVITLMWLTCSFDKLRFFYVLLTALGANVVTVMLFFWVQSEFCLCCKNCRELKVFLKENTLTLLALASNVQVCQTVFLHFSVVMLTSHLAVSVWFFKCCRQCCYAHIFLFY